MSFFNQIKNYITSEVLGIEETNNTIKNKPAKKNTTPVIKCKTEVPEDKFKKNTQVNQKNINNGNMSASAMRKTIVNFPSKNFDFNKMLKNGLLEKVTGLNEKELENLSTQEKNRIIEAIKFAASHIDSCNKVSKNSSKEELLIVFARNAYEAIKSGIFKNTQELEKEAGNISEELGNDFEKQPIQVKRQRIRVCRLNDDKKMQAEIASVKNLPKQERIAREKQIRNKYRYIRCRRFNDILMHKNSQTAVNSIIILDSKDMGRGAKAILQTRANREEKTRTADYANYVCTKSLIKGYKELGNEVETESLKDYTKTFMEYKSTSAAYEYQKCYKVDRDMYETALQKQRNGEALSAEEQEVLNTMKDEYYTASAQGIGEGALNNVNMNTGEKAKFINKWENDAKCYNDYKEVTQDIKKAINENTEYREIKEEIKAKNATQTKSAEAQSFKDNNVQSKYDENTHKKLEASTNTIINKTTTVPVQKQDIEQNTIILELKQKQQQTQNKENAYQVKSVGEAIDAYGHKAVIAILEDNSLNHLRPQLKGVIKSYDLNTLEEISLKCSDSSFVYICSLVDSENRNKLIDFRDKTKGLCYSAKKQIENLRGENTNA